MFLRRNWNIVTESVFGFALEVENTSWPQPQPNGRRSRKPGRLPYSICTPSYIILTADHCLTKIEQNEQLQRCCVAVIIFMCVAQTRSTAISGHWGHVLKTAKMINVFYQRRKFVWCLYRYKIFPQTFTFATVQRQHSEDSIQCTSCSIHVYVYNIWNTFTNISAVVEISCRFTNSTTVSISALAVTICAAQGWEGRHRNETETF